MSVLITVIELLIRIVQLPEVVATIGAATMPFIVKLSKEYLKKREANAPRELRIITVVSSSGKSIEIELGNMNDEEAKKTVSRLRDLTKVDASVPPT